VALDSLALHVPSSVAHNPLDELKQVISAIQTQAPPIVPLFLLETKEKLGWNF
jgi:hypothetical protein